jgi:hypothetical protein
MSDELHHECGVVAVYHLAGAEVSPLCPTQGPDEVSRQQAAIAEFLARMESLPDEGPDDGFSGRDHDKILYGAP